MTHPYDRIDGPTPADCKLDELEAERLFDEARAAGELDRVARELEPEEAPDGA